MELLETQDPEKKRLIETSDRHKRIGKEVNELSKKTERMVTNALIIGGSLAFYLFLVSSLSGRKETQA